MTDQKERYGIFWNGKRIDYLIVLAALFLTIVLVSFV